MLTARFCACNLSVASAALCHQLLHLACMLDHAVAAAEHRHKSNVLFLSGENAVHLEAFLYCKQTLSCCMLLHLACSTHAASKRGLLSTGRRV